MQMQKQPEVCYILQFKQYIGFDNNLDINNHDNQYCVNSTYMIIFYFALRATMDFFIYF